MRNFFIIAALVAILLTGYSLVTGLIFYLLSFEHSDEMWRLSGQFFIATLLCLGLSTLFSKEDQ